MTLEEIQKGQQGTGGQVAVSRSLRVLVGLLKAA